MRKLRLHRRDTLILIFLALAVFGVYVVLIRMVNGTRSQPMEHSLVVSAPPAGSRVETGSTLAVQVEVQGEDLERVEVWADEAPLFVSSRAIPAGSEVWSVAGEWPLGWPGEHQIFARAFAGEKMVLSEPLTVLAVPAGRLVFASNREGHYVLYTTDLDQHDVRPLFSGGGDSREPAPAPGGGTTFTQVLAGQHRSLWQITSDANSPAIFLEDTANLSQASWSPRGDALAYISNRNGRDQLWLCDADGLNEHALEFQAEAVAGPTWSLDGSRLAMTARQEQNWDIYRVQSDGQGFTLLTHSSTVDWQPAWSPVSDQIAFVSNRTGINQIFVMDADGNNTRQLTDLAGGAEQPRWSPDGAWIAFVGHAGAAEGLNARELFVMRGDGRDLLRLTENVWDDTEPAWLRPTPDDLPLPAGTSGLPMRLLAAYYANPTFNGEPLLRREESAIGYDWGQEEPVAGAPAERFSIRWEGTLSVETEGDYLCMLRADEGARLYLDDWLLVEAWGERGGAERSVPLRLSAGEHHLRVDYYENEGAATLHLDWRRLP